MRATHKRVYDESPSYVQAYEVRFAIQVAVTILGQNPIFGGFRFWLYFWWVKTCGSIQACSGRGIGP